MELFRRKTVEPRSLSPPRWLLGAALAGSVLAGSVAHSQTLLYSMSSNSGGAGAPAIQFASTNHDTLNVGTAVTVPMPDGSTSAGSVIMEHGADPLNSVTMLDTTGHKIISLDSGGSIELHLYNEAIVGMTISDLEQQTFHRSILDSSGAGILIEDDADEYICVQMPEEPINPNAAPVVPEEVPSLTTVQNLQSRPGATKVLYIDYWGGTLTGSAWNTTTGFPVISYAPYGGNSTFTSTELYYMYQAWAEAAEDYAPFNVNVTTKASVFAAASNANKSRIIATPTSTRDAYNICGSCGGVAYVGQYGGSILYQTGWTFNAGLTSMGQTHSHEAGHQMGLGHDGTATATYYSGHGDWGPIMGGPFGKPYVQWSRGSYPGANNTENDFSIINAKLGTLADVEGSTIATAFNLGTPSNYNSVRKSVPGGAIGAPSTFGDFDYYKFTVPTGGANVDLEAGPALGMDTTQNSGGETLGSNVTLQGGLYNLARTAYLERMYEDDVTPIRPNTNKLEYETNYLAAGTYYFWLENRSPDYVWSTGYDDWGNGGDYRVKLQVRGMPYANCGTITGANHNFGIVNYNYHDETKMQIRIGRTAFGTHYYANFNLRANEYEHFVTNLPTDGSTIYVTIGSLIDGSWRYAYRTCTTSSAGEPSIYAPLPGSELPATGDTFYWGSNGATVANYWLYVGTSLGGRQIHNSGLLTTTARYVNPLPTNGKPVYVRLWYRRTASGSWNYKDTVYDANYNGNDAIWTQPPEGASLGSIQRGYWRSGLVDLVNDRYRVYVGPSYGSTSWHFSGNIAANVTDYPISGWSGSDNGSTVWVRFLWRKAGVWKRSNHAYIAGSGPAAIFADDTAPVPVGQ